MRAVVWNSNSKHLHLNTVEDNDYSFKLLQSDLDELKLVNSTLVPDGKTTDDFTDADQTLSVAESATID